MSTLQSTDIFPVNRAFNPYRVSYADVIAGIPSATTGGRGLVQLADAAALAAGTAGRGVDAAGLKNSLTFTQAGALAKPRLVTAVLMDWVSVKDFGAIGDGTADDTAAFNAAVAASSMVYVPPGVYLIRSRIEIHKSGFTLFGAGKGVSTIKMPPGGLPGDSAIEIRTSRANNGAGGEIADVEIRDLTLGGNRTNGTIQACNLITVVCDSAHRVLRTRLINLAVRYSIGHGILLTGFMNGLDDAFKVEATLIQGCYFEANNGAGLGHLKANNSIVTNNIFLNGGLENLTVDVYSQSCIIDSNRFLGNGSGSGSVGIDSGDGCIISNNYFDGSNINTAPAGYRNGIALNSELTGGHGNNDVVITGNVIRNFLDYGIYIKDETGISHGGGGGFAYGGEKNGDALITGNQFIGCGVADVRVEDSIGPVIITGNRLNKLQVTDPDVSDVRVGAGDIAFDAYVKAQQVIAVAPSDPKWHKLNLDGLNGRLTTLNAGSLVLPVGGFYQFNSSIRMFGLTALDLDFFSVGLGQTPKGKPETIFAVNNIDKNPGAGASQDNLVEHSFSWGAFLPPGEVALYVRFNAVNAGNVTVDMPSTRLTGFSA
jgi:hypothetical protein